MTSASSGGGGAGERLQGVVRGCLDRAGQSGRGRNRSGGFRGLAEVNREGAEGGHALQELQAGAGLGELDTLVLGVFLVFPFGVRPQRFEPGFRLL